MQQDMRSHIICHSMQVILHAPFNSKPFYCNSAAYTGELECFLPAGKVPGLANNEATDGDFRIWCSWCCQVLMSYGDICHQRQHSKNSANMHHQQFSHNPQNILNPGGVSAEAFSGHATSSCAQASNMLSSTVLCRSIGLAQPGLHDFILL